MISEMEQARHAEQKGAILCALKEDYTARMTSMRSLRGGLSRVGFPMTAEALEFALVYLADCGYVRIWRVQDLPTYRGDRGASERADAIVFGKLLPKGLQLIDGLIDADAGVTF